MTQRDAVIFVNTRRTALEVQICFYAAARLGLDVVLLADAPIALAPGLVDEVVIVDTYDRVATVAAARAVALRRSVTGVVTWGDRDVENVASIAEDLGLPGHPPAAAAAARNKHIARVLLEKAAPYLVPRFHHIRDAADLGPAMDQVGFPAILKPAGASGSKGIFRVEDASQLSVAFDRLMEFTRPEQDPIFRYYPQELILEERLGGSEHSVQGIVVDGRVICWGVTDKWVTTPFCLQYLQVYPSALPVATLDRVLTAANDAITALGLDRGAIAMDLRCLPDGSVKVIEVNARCGGNFIASHLIPLSQGYDILGAALQVATGADPEPMPAATGVVAGSIQVITKQEGWFTGFDSLGTALAVPGVDHFTYEIPPGTEVRQPPDDFVTPILATFIGRALDQQALTRLLRDVAERCHPVIQQD